LGGDARERGEETEGLWAMICFQKKRKGRIPHGDTGETTHMGYLWCSPNEVYEVSENMQGGLLKGKKGSWRGKHGGKKERGFVYHVFRGGNLTKGKKSYSG